MAALTATALNHHRRPCFDLMYHRRRAVGVQTRHTHAITSTMVNGAAGGNYTYDPDCDPLTRPGPNGQGR